MDGCQKHSKAAYKMPKNEDVSHKSIFIFSNAPFEHNMDCFLNCLFKGFFNLYSYSFAHLIALNPCSNISLIGMIH